MQFKLPPCINESVISIRLSHLKCCSLNCSCGQGEQEKRKEKKESKMQTNTAELIEFPILLLLLSHSFLPFRLPPILAIKLGDI